MQTTYSSDGEDNCGDWNALRSPHFLDATGIRFGPLAEQGDLEKFLNHRVTPDLGLLRRLSLISMMRVSDRMTMGRMAYIQVNSTICELCLLK